jgi:hypothetical protein
MQKIVAEPPPSTLSPYIYRVLGVPHSGVAKRRWKENMG